MEATASGMNEDLEILLAFVDLEFPTIFLGKCYLPFTFANARHNPSPAPKVYSPTTAPAPKVDSPTATQTSTGDGSLGAFDVTKYGAVADAKTDSKSRRILSRPSVFLWALTCNKSPNVEIRGTLKAPPDMSAFEDSAWLEFGDLSSINITRAGTGMLDGHAEASYGRSGCHNVRGKCKNYPITLKIVKVSGGMINNIALVNSKGFHMNFLMSNNILIQDLNITAPNKSPNTDGIHISQSTNINITSSIVGVGDDCITIGPGNNNIFISKIICGPGHGSPPSKANNLTFEDIIMTNVKNPISIDQEYCPGRGCETNKPSQVKISDVLFKNIRGTATTKSEVTLVCSSSMACENVVLANIDLKYILLDGPATSTCTNVKGIFISGMENP
ncbi:hypothetical protein IFM89_033688 [Coptis chinensis]|uniref:Polygalacturonase n=1 Tax=Coptis chinensis TaxID=261450 RepID=A0A835LTM2_9MAGN|nr:hypothetical protein IFM89_033688 [Coptis chinensis]